MKTKFNFVPLLAIVVLVLWSFMASASAKDPIGDNVTTAVNSSVDGVKTVYNDLKSTAPEIKDALESAAKELKVGVNKVWDILVNQQRVWSIAYLMLSIASIISWYGFYRYNFGIMQTGEYKIQTIKKFAQIKNPKYESFYDGRGGYEDDIRGKRWINDQDDYTEEPTAIPVRLERIKWFKYVHLTVCLILSFFSYYHFSDMLTGFINPEYGAMKTILTFAQGVK